MLTVLDFTSSNYKMNSTFCCAVESLHYPLILKRLDARYDWLPSPASTFQEKSVSLLYVNDGCDVTSQVKGQVAIVTDMGCSYFQKVSGKRFNGHLENVV